MREDSPGAVVFHFFSRRVSIYYNIYFRERSSLQEKSIYFYNPRNPRYRTMVTDISKKWHECNICRATYPTRKEAEDCEKSRKPLDVDTEDTDFV